MTRTACISTLLTVAAMAALSPAAPSNSDEDAAGKPRESIEVTIHGRLRTGIVAIGGETTGTTISASNLTFELDLSETELQGKMEEWDGRTVVVKGTLAGKKGVEVRLRQIVTVESLQPVEAE